MRFFRAAYAHHSAADIEARRDRQGTNPGRVSGNQVFSGTDSAPHARNATGSWCGCAGMHRACRIELYAEIFGANNALDKLQGLPVFLGPSFYGPPPIGQDYAR
jgi:dihydroorotase